MPASVSHFPELPDNQLFLNRELSWLAFNERVLEEAENQEVPLLERVNFLAISASNLDEFYMVRVAGLKDYLYESIDHTSLDGLDPEEELTLIDTRIKSLITRQEQCWETIHAALATENIEVVSAIDLTSKEFEAVKRYFENNLFPALTPIAIDPAHPFPFLPNLTLSLVFSLVDDMSKQERTAIVPLPSALPRFIPVSHSKKRFILLEEAIASFIGMLFPDYHVKESSVFRVTRDSDLDIEDEGEDFVRNFERAVKERRRGRVINLHFPAGSSEQLMDFVAEHMRVEKEDIWCFGELLGMRHVRELCEIKRPALKYPAFKVRFPERINEFGGDCFAAIAAKDILVHHPFESFDVVVKFLEQAARDPKVVSIKQTLYRTSADSPIVKALIEAAEAGKSVTALVELKARFDEEANLRFSRDLERAGVQVSYGFVQLKTHAKVSLVTRKEEKKLVSYVHFGTGNYHPATARLYTDLSFFTCDPILCRDAAYFFNFVTGYAPPKSFKKLIVAPKTMRSSMIDLINREITHVEKGKPGAIWAKMNSLVDPGLIKALYAASQAGVEITLIVRGICCLRPGVSGLSENITVKSVVGRFLEHSRIFCFGNGHALPSSKALVYMGSADWMSRNLDWRVETLVPIENPTVHEQILSQIMAGYITDEKQSWTMQGDGSYIRVTSGKDTISAHEYFMRNPSLSGRGKALNKRKPSKFLHLKVAK